ncbi:MAG TPA: hypothetical protein EYP18_03845, partial [Desulfobacterales bacterium]|nr:hypothetical protein [Desulfobacterales bacterium]
MFQIRPAVASEPIHENLLDLKAFLLSSRKSMVSMMACFNLFLETAASGPALVSSPGENGLGIL